MNNKKTWWTTGTILGGGVAHPNQIEDTTFKKISGYSRYQSFPGKVYGKFEIEVEVDGQTRRYYGYHDYLGGGTCIYDIWNARRYYFPSHYYESSSHLHLYYLPMYYLFCIKLIHSKTDWFIQLQSEHINPKRAIQEMMDEDA